MIGPRAISFILAFFSGVMLIVTSQIVQGLEHQKAQLLDQIEKEKRDIEFLEAEWAYLNRPDRLHKLVNSHILNIDDGFGQVELQDDDVYVGQAHFVSHIVPAPKPRDQLNAVSAAEIAQDASSEHDVKRISEDRNGNQDSEGEDFFRLINALNQDIDLEDE